MLKKVFNWFIIGIKHRKIVTEHLFTFLYFFMFDKITKQAYIRHNVQKIKIIITKQNYEQIMVTNIIQEIRLIT